MIRGIIYKWTNIITNKVYIGKTTREKQRKQEHLKDRKRYDFAFYRALNKYGVENFTYEVLFETYSNSKEKINIVLNALETYYIKKYSSRDKRYGYNLTSGGDGGKGVKLSKEQRLLRSERMKGEKNPMYGKHLSENQRKLLIESRIGHRPYNNKEVIQLSLDGNYINEYESALKAALSVGKYNDRSNITKACKQGRTALGYKWKYKYEENNN